MDEAEDVIMTIAEVADYLRMHRSTLYGYARSGKIPAYYISGNWRFRLSEVQSWLEQRELESKNEYSTTTEIQYRKQRKTKNRKEAVLRRELLQSELLDGIAVSEQEKIFSALEWEIVSFKRDDRLVKRKTLMDYFYIVYEGAVELIREPWNVKEELRLLGRGKIVGLDVCLSTQRVCHYELRGKRAGAALKICTDSLLRNNRLQPASHERLRYNLSVYLAEMAIQRSKQMDILRLSNLQDRILAYLLAREEEHGGSPFQLPERFVAMAEFLNISSSALSGQLNYLKEMDLIAIKGNTIWMNHERINAYSQRQGVL